MFIINRIRQLIQPSFEDSATTHASSTKTNPPSKTTMTTFNDLPAEMRNMIYELALAHDEPISLSPHTSTSNAFVKPNLLATCRRIRDEATPIFYGNNTFDVPSTRAATSFLKQLRPESVQSIQRLRVFAGFQLEIPAWMRDDHMRSRVNMIEEMVKDYDGLTTRAVMIPALAEQESEQWVRVVDVVLDEEEQERESSKTEKEVSRVPALKAQ